MELFYSTADYVIISCYTYYFRNIKIHTKNDVYIQWSVESFCYVNILPSFKYSK